MRSREVEKEQELDRLKRNCASLQKRLDEKEHNKGGAGEQEVQAEHARLTAELVEAEERENK